MRGEALRNWVSKCSSPCRKLDAFQFFSRENELLCTSSCSSQVISSVLQRMRATSTSQSSVPSWDFFFKEIFQILLSLGHLWGGNDHLCLSWWGGKLELQFGVWTTIALDELTFVWRHIVNLEWRKKRSAIISVIPTSLWTTYFAMHCVTRHRRAFVDSYCYLSHILYL